ncbi:S-layer homology domain-containing protein [Paenibacillus sp. GSMTC-2017]|uniref:S-layer homology domain-containing protein n=1 Tax=Paenibacillus sp. GSMTC-2017 TaxID=2794350 RepID=UPI0018D65F72|nr:S-layer homology domain-containing protein [Paenibacillus sp. GSMTC-2017]MBH5318306.1 S-layer homology domain-containing protein [Paenibacillus sp. GSMTC-2017]
MFKGLRKKVISSFLIMTVVGSTVLSAFASANEGENYETKAVNSLPLESQKGILSTPLSSDQDVVNYLTANKTKLGFSGPKEELQLQAKTSDSFGGSHYLYQLQHNNIPVYGKYIRVHLDKTKRINEIRNEVASNLLPSLPQSTTPKLTKAEAIEQLKAAVESELGEAIPDDQSFGELPAASNTASLIIYPFEGNTYLAYEVELNFLTPAPGKWIAYVDALNGKVIDKYNSIHQAESPAEVIGKGKGRDDAGNEIDLDRPLNLVIEDFDNEDVTDNVYILSDVSREMYDSNANKGFINTYNYIGPTETDFSLIKVTAPFINKVDHNAVNAHYYTGLVYEYFKNTHNRNSIDDKGMNMASVVNYSPDGEPFDNAFWYNYTMYYGNGTCFSCALDVIAHEVTHGVTDFSSDLEYRNQSGALNESFSDIFGNLIEMEVEGNENWTIGEDSGLLLRSMSDPNIYGDPATINQYLYFPRSYDQGGVHFNSGIQNKAAYLIATKIDSLDLDGKAILGQLSYDVLVNRLTPISGFEDSRDAFVSAAEAYVANNNEDAGIIEAVKEAWAEVGLPYEQNYDITSVSLAVPGAGEAWIENNSFHVFINVPQGTPVSQINPVITVAPGATLTAIDTDFSDSLGKYEVSAQGTKVKWNVIVAYGVPVVSYESTPFVEKNNNSGELHGVITIKYNAPGDKFNFTDIGEDFIVTNKVVVSPIPKGLTALATVTGTNEIQLIITGNAEEHTNREDIDNLSIRFMDYAFTNAYEYQIKDYHKDGFTIDFKSDLEIVTNTDTTTTLEWEAASNASAIKLLQSSDEGVTWIDAITAETIVPSSTEATVTGLTTSGQYQFKLVITGGEDDGDTIIVSRNDVPHVKDTIAIQSVVEDGAELNVSFANVFVNPNETQPLTYLATSSTPGIATATVNLANESLTIDPISAGTTIITVQADNGQGSTASTSFTVTVTPVIKHELTIVASTDKTVTLKWPAVSNASKIELFQSMDQGITWNQASTANAILPTSTETTVTGLTPAGQYQFKLVITGGEDAGDSIIVARNEVLYVANTIANQSLADNAADLSVSFANVFVNPIAADSLTYTVTSSTYGVASATINNQSLTIDPISAGTSIITVKADNSKGNIASTSFTVTVTSTRSYSGGGGYVVPTGPVTSTNGKVTIPAGQAGEVGLGTDVNVVIPAGASNKELKITIEKVLDQSSLVTDKITLASPIFEILKNITENFSKKVTLKLTFDPTKVGANQKPVIFYYDEVKKVWVEVAGGTVSGNQITVEVDHFTKFAVLAVDTKVEPTVSFSDIAGHWAEANIKQAVAAGFVNGYSNGTFKPNGAVMREEFAVMLMKVLKSEQKGETLIFTDSAKVEAWAKDSVAQAVKLGIITGYSDGSFRPDATITRSEMASMIAKALELKVVAGAKTDFADDASIPAWAKAAISAVKEAGIMQGKAGNLFKPSAQATRAEAVTVLLKVLPEDAE